MAPTDGISVALPEPQTVFRSSELLFLSPITCMHLSDGTLSHRTVASMKASGEQRPVAVVRGVAGVAAPPHGMAWLKRHPAGPRRFQPRSSPV